MTSARSILFAAQLLRPLLHHTPDARVDVRLNEMSR
jgi:hypothetical protein